MGVREDVRNHPLSSSHWRGAVLVALMLYDDDEERDHRSSIRIVPTITDR